MSVFTTTDNNYSIQIPNITDPAKATNLLAERVQLGATIVKDINDLILCLVVIQIIKCLSSIFLTKCTHI